MGKVIGIGGVFFKSNDPEKLKEWYQHNLGFEIDPYGVQFKNQNNIKGATLWSPFNEDSKYFEPSKKEFMLNLVVDNLESLITKLQDANISIIGEVASYDYGKFAHILDIEGNKIELWEPIYE